MTEQRETGSPITITPEEYRDYFGGIVLDIARAEKFCKARGITIGKDSVEIMIGGKLFHVCTEEDDWGSLDQGDPDIEPLLEELDHPMKEAPKKEIVGMKALYIPDDTQMTERGIIVEGTKESKKVKIKLDSSGQIMEVPLSNCALLETDP